MPLAEGHLSTSLNITAVEEELKAIEMEIRKSRDANLPGYLAKKSLDEIEKRVARVRSTLMQPIGELQAFYRVADLIAARIAQQGPIAHTFESAALSAAQKVVHAMEKDRATRTLMDQFSRSTRPESMLHEVLHALDVNMYDPSWLNAPRNVLEWTLRFKLRAFVPAETDCERLTAILLTRRDEIIASLQKQREDAAVEREKASKDAQGVQAIAPGIPKRTLMWRTETNHELFWGEHDEEARSLLYVNDPERCVIAHSNGIWFLYVSLVPENEASPWPNLTEAAKDVKENATLTAERLDWVCFDGDEKITLRQWFQRRGRVWPVLFPV